MITALTPDRMDAPGRAWLAGLEGGCRLAAYCDVHDRRPCPVGCRGVWTIGVGMTLLYGRPVKRGDTLPGFDIGLAMFEDGLARDYVPGVLKGLQRDIDQRRFNAFVSFAYNVGVGEYRSSTALRRFNAGASPESVVAAMLWFNKSGGKINPAVIERRTCEADLFLYRQYRTQGQPRPFAVPPATGQKDPA